MFGGGQAKAQGLGDVSGKETSTASSNPWGDADSGGEGDTMSHRIGFGITAALTALLALGPSCQKNGETEMRPASGVNPNYREEAPIHPPEDTNAYPQPGSGTGVPGTQTTPGATEPGETEIPRRGDPTTLQPGGFPVEDEPTTSEPMTSEPMTSEPMPSDTWGSERMAGGTGGAPSKPKGTGGKGSAGHHSH